MPRSKRSKHADASTDCSTRAGKWLIPLLLALWQGTFPAFGQKLLPEQQAFEFVAERQPDGAVRAEWRIADDYYMYRDKTRFSLGRAPETALALTFPDGEAKNDPLFGNVEVYTSGFAVTIPANLVATTEFTLVAEGQGCNEPVGVCYPPMKREIGFGLDPPPQPAVQPLITMDAPTDSVRELRNLFATDQDDPGPTAQPDTEPIDSLTELRELLAQGYAGGEFLDVDDAFSLHFAFATPTTLRGNFAVAPGYYLYKEKIAIEASGGAQITALELPPGNLKQDPYFGAMEVYEQDFAIPLTLTGDPAAARLTATYQGCAVDGICYAPVTRTFDLGDLPLAVVSAATPAAASPGAGLSAPSPGLGLLFGAFVAGLLLTFTPCVLPMIPILSSIIAGQGKRVTRTTGGLLAISYVAGTMVTYAAMGALAGATGDQLQAYFQNIWAIGALSLLFFIMALSMFGLFELKMPAFIQNMIQTKTHFMGGSIPLVFLLGLFSALIIGACVSPVVVSFLGLAISNQDPVLGAQLMLTMALGMGLPLIVLGIGAGHLLPRAGQWMVKVKQGFGVMLIAVAIYLAGLLPEVPVLLLWGGFFIILAMFLGPAERQTTALTPWQRCEKGIGTILLVWGIVALIGGLLGQRELLNPIPRTLFAPGAGPAAQHTGLVFTRVADIAELEQQLAHAKAEGKNVMIDYYADWCVECIRMEQTTFADPTVKARLETDFINIQIDLTDPNHPGGKALKQRYNVFGPPATLFIDRHGRLLDERNFYGYKNRDEFLAVIEGV